MQSLTLPVLGKTSYVMVGVFVVVAFLVFKNRTMLLAKLKSL